MTYYYYQLDPREDPRNLHKVAEKAAREREKHAKEDAFSAKVRGLLSRFTQSDAGKETPLPRTEEIQVPFILPLPPEETDTEELQAVAMTPSPIVAARMAFQAAVRHHVEIWTEQHGHTPSRIEISQSDYATYISGSPDWKDGYPHHRQMIPWKPLLTIAPNHISCR